MGLFSSSDATCPVEGDTGTGEPIGGNLTFQHIILIVGGACLLFTLVSSLTLITKHLHIYTTPAEQRPILRIVFTPVVFATTNLLAIAFYSAAQYLTPIADLYEAFALASLFLLFVQYIAPDSQSHNTFFSELENKSRKGEVSPGGSLNWFNRIWIVVFLYCIVKSILFIAQEASQATGKYCATSNNVHFAHIWITILNAIFIAIAVLAILRFYRRFRPEMKTRRPLTKLVTFKLIVFTNFVQILVFSFLNSGGHLKGNSKVIHQDLWIGIPALLICVEQVIFSTLFHHSYRSREYRCDRQQKQQERNERMNIIHAAANALNPSDLLAGVARAVTLLFSPSGTRRANETHSEYVSPGWHPRAGY